MAGPLDLRGRVTIIDAGATGTLNRIRGAMSAVAGAARNPTNALGSMQRATTRLGTAATGIGGFGATFAAGYFLKSQFDFEKALNKTQAKLRITEKEAFRPLRNEIVRLAETYPAMRKEIAEGSSDLAEAGMNLDTIKAVLEGTIQGSMASGESIATVAGGVTDVVMSMAMPFKTASEQAESFRMVNDKLAAASTTYNQSYTKMLLGIGRSGPVARAAGVNLHDLAAMLGTLADANFKGERGGIAMSSMLLRLGAPTKKARGELARLGVDITKFQRQTGKFENMGATPLVDMLEEELGLSDAAGLSDSINQLLKDKSLTANAQNLGDALNKLITDGLGVSAGDAENSAKINDVVSRYVRSAFSTLDFVGVMRELAGKDADKSLTALNEIFGKYHAAKGAALLSSIRSGAFDDKSVLLMQRTANATVQIAEIMMQGFVGAVYRMQSAWDAFLDRLSETGVLDTVTGAITDVTKAIGSLAETNPRLLEFGTYAILITGLMAPLGFALSGFASAAALLVGAAGIILRLTGALRVFAPIARLAGSVAARLGAALGLLGGGAAAGASARMLAGMGRAGATAGGVAAGAAGGGFLARMLGVGGLKAGAKMGLRFIPGLGLVLMAGGALYGGYKAWSNGGDAGDVAKESALGAIGLDGLSDTDVEVGQPRIEGSAGPGTSSQLAAIEAQAQQAAARVRETMNLDLTAEGMRAGQTFASGLAQGMQAAVTAAENAASRIRAAAGGVQLNTGPSMRGAN